VGESGCGKTTAILALIGLLPGSASVAGHVYLHDEDVLAKGEETISPHRWNDIAMVFQGAMNAFNPVKTIGTQIAEPMELHGTSTGRAARAQVRELLELVGISGERADRYPHEFSGGMRQRVAIATALLNRPDLIIADEPTTALDVTIQSQILFEVQKLSRETGAAVLWITHDLAVVAELADRVAVMYAGRIVETGTVDDVLDRPRHPYTLGLLGSSSATVAPGERLKQINGAAPSIDARPSGCPFRPRCERALNLCAEIDPLPQVMSNGQSYRCHNPVPEGPAP